MMFFPETHFYEKPQDYHFDYEDVALTTEDDIQLHGWYLRAKEEKAVLLFLHGNAGNISNRLSKAKGWVDRGFSVLLLDYRGYGKSKGKILGEGDVIQDSEAALQWLMQDKKVPLRKLIFYGESLGTHPALQLGAAGEAAAVILEAPFTSFTELAKIHYPFIPEMILKDFSFSNRDSIAKLKTPLFILHGTRDSICPYSMAEELFKKAPNPKEFLSVPNGDHNDLPISAGEDYWEKPVRFIEKYLKTER